MKEILDFIRGHPYFTATITAANVAVLTAVQEILKTAWSSRIREAKAGRGGDKRPTAKYMRLAKSSIESYGRREKQAGIYLKAKEKVKHSGYRSEYAAVIYLALRYLMPSALFITAFISNFPQVKGAILLTAASIGALEYIMWSRRREITKNLQISAYKIYQFLHNQVSSGVKVSDAIKTVYEVVAHKGIKEILLQFAVQYHLTLDIDTALQEFRSYFASQEADTLAIAIKSGIDTGDNQNILEKQERAMFRKYVNYIQAETKACQFKSFLSVVFFTSILIIMYAVPMFRDIGEAANKIFITP